MQAHVRQNYIVCAPLVIALMYTSEHVEGIQKSAPEAAGCIMLSIGGIRMCDMSAAAFRCALIRALEVAAIKLDWAHCVLPGTLPAHELVSPESLIASGHSSLCGPASPPYRRAAFASFLPQGRFQTGESVTIWSGRTPAPLISTTQSRTLAPLMIPTSACPLTLEEGLALPTASEWLGKIRFFNHAGSPRCLGSRVPSIWIRPECSAVGAGVAGSRHTVTGGAYCMARQSVSFADWISHYFLCRASPQTAYPMLHATARPF